MTRQGATWPLRLLHRGQWSTLAMMEIDLINAQIAQLMAVQIDPGNFYKNAVFALSAARRPTQQAEIDRLTHRALFAVTSPRRDGAEGDPSGSLRCPRFARARAACAALGAPYPLKEPTSDDCARCLSARMVRLIHRTCSFISPPGRKIEAYLAKSKAILIPIGSTEQHGPNGLLGTDALCPEIIGTPRRRRGGHSDRADLQCRPGAASHGVSPARSRLRPSTMIAAMLDWAQSPDAPRLRAHLLAERPWRQHRHHHGRVLRDLSRRHVSTAPARNHPPLRCTLRNWWELPGVMDLCRQLFPVGEGSHATPREVSVTYFGYPDAIKRVAMTPRIAPNGPILRRRGLPPPLPRRPHRLRSRRRPPSRPARRSWPRR